MIARIPRSCGFGLMFHGLMLVMSGIQLLAVHLS
jgi:hypothetical protein